MTIKLRKVFTISAIQAGFHTYKQAGTVLMFTGVLRLCKYYLNSQSPLLQKCLLHGPQSRSFRSFANVPMSQNSTDMEHLWASKSDFSGCCHFCVLLFYLYSTSLVLCKFVHQSTKPDRSICIIMMRSESFACLYLSFLLCWIYSNRNYPSVARSGQKKRHIQKQS